MGMGQTLSWKIHRQYYSCGIRRGLELILDCCTDIVHFEDGSIIDQFPMDADGLEKIRNYFIKGVSVK